MDYVKMILTDSRFWSAFFVLANAIVFTIWPNFPQTIWSSLDALVAMILIIIAGKSVIAKVATAKEVKAVKNVAKGSDQNNP